MATLLAMVAFAANSVLCRLALGAGLIDAASFATIRVVSGAVALVAIMLVQRRSLATKSPDWRTVASLFIYVACFSFAYVTLTTSTGALILFGTVQLTMFAVAFYSGERFAWPAVSGLALALSGLLYLLLPGVTSPDPLGAVLMVAAGIAWGIYSLLGRGTTDPLGATTWNFVFSVPLVLIVSVVAFGEMHLSGKGAALAVASGAIASGCGYVIWYVALRGLTAARAATVQLSVPVIAAIGGIVLLSEPITLRLVVASVATLGGVAIVLAQRPRGGGDEGDAG